MLSILRRLRFLILASVGLVAAIAFWYFTIRTLPIPQRTLRIGFEQVPPVQIRTRNGFSGLAVETVSEAAKRAGLSLQWVETGMSSEESLRRGLVDLWPIVVDLPERRKHLHITKPWLQTSHTLVLPAERETPGREFAGHIALLKLPIHARLVRQEFPNAQLVQFVQAGEVLKEVCRGTVFAGFLDDRAGLAALREKPTECAAMELRVHPLPRLTFPLGVGSTFDAAGAADRIRDNIGGLFRDGTMAVTMAKYSYFGIDSAWATYALMAAEEHARFVAWGIGGLGIALAITVWQAASLRQRKRSQTALRESEERFRLATKATNDAIWDIDLKAGTVSLNDTYSLLYGSPESADSWQFWIDQIHPEDRSRTADEFQAALDGDSTSWSAEYRYRRANGEWADIYDRAYIARDTSGNAWRVIGAMQDLTEQKKAEAALRESEQQLASIYNTVRDVIFYLAVEPDGQFRFISVNPAFLTVTGLSREAVLGKTVNDVIPEPSLTIVLEKYRQVIQQKTAVFWEETSSYPAGRLTGEVSVAPVFDNNGTCTHLVGSVHDITDRRQAEAERERLWAQLAQSQKMESVGRLAGGLAHDFNNLMSVILMHADSAIEALREGHSAAESLKEIREATERGVAFGRQLMAFSSKQVLHPEILNLNSVIANCQNLIRRLIGEDVKVVFESGPGLCFVKADRGQLAQVLMNLAVNSRDAMPEGGTFTIETAAVELDESIAQLSPGAKPGPYVMFAVRDTGIGMDQATQARAFEPFFTTKGVGKGTGLGLSIVYGLVNQSGGFITFTSDAGHGTEFRIYLPAVVEAPEPIPGADGPIRGGSETILLVEDEPALRNKIHELLENAGYKVLAAPDGEQAYRLSLRDARPIHLLLTDVVMPNLSGTRLSERVRNLRPETQVLYMSGYPASGDVKIDRQSLPNFIEKPFTREGLLRRVREVLDGNITVGASR